MNTGIESYSAGGHTATVYEVVSATTVFVAASDPTRTWCYYWCCDCGTSGPLMTTRPAAVSAASKHVDQHAKQRREELRQILTLPISIGHGGHNVNIVPGDHPAVRAMVKQIPWKNGDSPNSVRARMRFEARVALCSCGATVCWYSSDNIADNHRRAAREADKHCRRSDREPRDYKWTRLRGWVPKVATNQKENEMRIDTTPSKADRLRARRDEIEVELARLDELPDEPMVDEAEEGSEPNVIWFVKRFSTVSRYTYSAVRAGDGLWYTSGPRSPKGYNWERLIEWINQDEDPSFPVEVYWATSWDELI